MILLISPPGFDGIRLADILEQSALKISVLWGRAGTLPAIPEGIRRAIAVLPERSLVANGEAITQLHARLGPAVPLVVCCSQVSASDRKLLHECGATSLVCPRGWEISLVAERILGELILNGDVRPAQLGSLHGATCAMQRAYHQIETLAPLREPVLILGETGSGKELVAREMHRASNQKAELMPLNCAALTPELVESELFGHERGAFTNAMTRRQGLLVEAGRGTVFLDEIGDLTLTSQAKLLRVLEERKVRPVGSNTWASIEARLIFATHRDLDEACRERVFRQDLYERLRGFTIQLPPLRERRADIPLLVQHFLAEYNRDYPGNRTVPDGVLDTLFRYDWPGNVRELRNAVRQAAAYTGGDRGPISALHLLEVAQRSTSDSRPHTVSFDPSSETWREVHDRVRAKYLRAVLAYCGGQKEAAAKKAGLSRSQFYELWKEIEDSRQKDS